MNYAKRSIIFPVRASRGFAVMGPSEPSSGMNPSVLFPALGLVAAYFATRNKPEVMPWALAAGALAGLTINANLRTYQAQLAITRIGGDLGQGPFKAPSYGAQVIESATGKPLSVTWSPNLVYSAAIDKAASDAAAQLPQVAT